jgi:hypothetical protein
MKKKYSAEEIASALQHESQVADTMARISRADSYIEETTRDIDKLQKKLAAQIKDKESLLDDLDRLDAMKAANAELFDVLRAMADIRPVERKVQRTAGGRMPKISTNNKVQLITRALKEFDDNRKDHIWDDSKTVPLYFIKQYIEEVEEIEIGNITIFLRKAIEEGKFVVVGSTRTRAIKVKR